MSRPSEPERRGGVGARRHRVIFALPSGSPRRDTAWPNRVAEYVTIDLHVKCVVEHKDFLDSTERTSFFDGDKPANEARVKAMVKDLYSSGYELRSKSSPNAPWVPPPSVRLRTPASRPAFL